MKALSYGDTCTESVPRREEGSTGKYQHEVKGVPEGAARGNSRDRMGGKKTPRPNGGKKKKRDPGFQDPDILQVWSKHRKKKGNRLGFFLVLLNNNINNSLILSINYSHRNSHSYGMANHYEYL